MLKFPYTTVRHNLPIKAIGWVSLFLFSHICSAYEFVPTDMEFSAWPSYCQAKYVTTVVGQSQQWSLTYPKSAIERVRQELGQSTFEYIHHYCAGLTMLSRARYESNPQKKASILSDARSEIDFTFQRIPETSLIYTTVLITYARLEQEAKQFDAAKSYAERAISIDPHDPTAYIVLALQYRAQGDLESAKQVLDKGNAALEEGSAEIHYNLGLILLELGETQDAVSHAERAYDLGYPLMGLKNKLIEKRLWRAAAN